MDKNEIIRRYVYDVTRRLPQQGREDIERELTGNIYDMLEARAGENYTEGDVRAVLKELGSPAELAASFADAKRALISGDYYDKYTFILKIVMPCVVFGLLTAAIVESAAFPSAVGDIFIAFAGNLLMGVVAAFGFVTLMFAIFERARVRVDMEQWSVEKLPPVPDKSNLIKRSEPIAMIVFTMLVILLFNMAPQYMGIINIQDGIVLAPIFNLDVLRSTLPIVNLCFTLGIVREICCVAEGRYTPRLTIFITVVNIFSLAVLIPALLNTALWNLGAPSLLPEGWPNLSYIFMLTFVAAFILAYAVNTGKALYHCVRRDNK